MERSSISRLILPLVLCLLLGGCMTVDVRLSDFMIPDHAPRMATLARGYAVQDLIIHRGGRLIGITHAHHPDSEAIIVYCGGNAFRRSVAGGTALEALARGADVILFDYPGYGESTGTPDAAVILETALAVYDYAENLATSAGKKRVLYGFSLGGLVAAQVARDRAVTGLVLEASAPSVESWARTQIPWFAKPWVTARIEAGLAAIDSATALEEFHGRVLLLASASDVQAPAALSEQLHSSLRRAGVDVELAQFRDAPHGHIPHSAAFAPTLRKFLQRLEAPQQ